MKLSIIIPVYNVEKYVERCLRSILNQGISEKEYEIIIQNDGSTDDSLAIVERIVKEYSNCLVLSSQNRGLSAARNAALCHASGEYVWFVDSDDWIEDGCLSILLNEIDDTHADIYDFGYKSSLNNVISVSEMPKEKMLIPVWTHLYKRKFLQKNQLCFFEGIAHEDYEFSPRVAFLAKTIVTLDISPYIVYKRPNSITTTPNYKKALDMITVSRSLANFHSKYQTEGCDFTELIAQGLNNALQTMHMFRFSKDKEDEINVALEENKDLFSYLWKSKRLKYKIEYCIFKLFPHNYVRDFKRMKLFSIRYLKMDKITNGE